MKKSISILIALLVLLSLIGTAPAQGHGAAPPLAPEAQSEQAQEAIPLEARGRFAPLSGGDTCSAATDLASLGFACDGFTYSDTLDMSSATPSGGPAGSCWLDGPSVDNDRWYVWTNTTGAAVSLNVSTDDPVNSGGDSQIALYDGCAAPTELACSEDTIGNFLSDVTLDVAVGETVYIQVDGFGGDAFFDQAFFTCSAATTPPANDERANATAVSTVPFFDTVDTSGATTAADDPSMSCGDVGKPEQSASVWYAYTPPQAGLVEVSEIWDGSGATLAPLAPPACNDEALICGPQSRLTDVALEADTTYYIEVTGAGSQGGGNLSLSIDLIPTAVDLLSFEAKPKARGIRIRWETANEIDTLGFNLYRAESPDGTPVLLNDSLIPAGAPGSPTGGSYVWFDRPLQAGHTYYYWLDDVNLNGVATRHGPVSARAKFKKPR
jgi:hypothetical protein